MKWRKKFYPNTIRKRMLFYFLMPIILISLVSFYLSMNSGYFIKKVDYMFQSILVLEDMKNYLEEGEKNLTVFIKTKDSMSKKRYQTNVDLLKDSMHKLEGILYVSYYNTSRLNNLITTFSDNAQKAINAKQGRDANAMRENYSDVHMTSGYIIEEIEELNLKLLKTNTKYYSALSINNVIVSRANFIMIITILVLSFMIILYTTYKMTDPIVKLSHMAEEISRGNFNIDEMIVTSEDEIKVLVEAFNKMKLNVQNYIETLSSKMEIESKLMEKEMQNLKMQTLLNNAELQSLQSQINPHFLFNTLNAGVQLAMIEEADRTSYFLENLASVFRYNVRKLDNEVTLRDEINSIRAYTDLMKVRFGDMIEFNEYIEDDKFLYIKMPPLILQPIIENSCIHGIGEKEGEGKISIHVYRENSNGIIEIHDNGAGMTREEVDEIYKSAEKGVYSLTKSRRGHTTGIGINNVIQRLRLYFGYQDVICIVSEKGEGTSVIIRIPDIKGDLDV